MKKSDFNETQSAHKNIAMTFLKSANEKCEVPLDEKYLEMVYDLLANKEQSDTDFQKGLEKIFKGS